MTVNSVNFHIFGLLYSNRIDNRINNNFPIPKDLKPCAQNDLYFFYQN